MPLADSNPIATVRPSFAHYPIRGAEDENPSQTAHVGKPVADSGVPQRMFAVLDGFRDAGTDAAVGGGSDRGADGQQERPSRADPAGDPARASAVLRGPAGPAGDSADHAESDARGAVHLRRVSG